MKYIAVMASKKRDFDNFIKSIATVDRNKFKLVMMDSDTRGYEFLTAISIGDYERIPHYQSLHSIVYARIR